MNTLTSWSDIKNVLYINLQQRDDRRHDVLRQLNDVGITDPHRFDAVYLPSNRALGCTVSHIGCVERAKQENWDHVLILEDDFWVCDGDGLQQRVTAFLSHYPKDEDWDVLLLCGNNFRPFESCNYPEIIRVRNCQCSTAYLVKQSYYDTLLANFHRGAVGLSQQPRNHPQYAIDQYWKLLQQTDRWFLIVPIAALQKPGLSDLAGYRVDYTSEMMVYDKC